MAERTTRWLGWTALALAAGGSVAVGAAGGATQQTAQALPPLVAPGPNACLPGSGSRNWCGDGGPATRAKLGGPHDVAIAADGTLVIAETANNVIRRVTPDGVIGTLAGDGATPRRAPRAVEPAARPLFDEPAGVAVEPDGSVLVADTGNDAIRRIRHDGRVEIVIGGRRNAGAKLDLPSDVVSLPNGDMLVADTRGNRVLRRTAAGAISVVAGTGEFGFRRDGVPATESPLRLPVQLAVMPGGQVLIADQGDATVRIVSTSGIINTLHESGDSVEGVGWTPDHGVVMARSTIVGRARNTQSEIVRLDPSGGPPVRLAGLGRDGFTADAGLGTRVALSMPRQLAVASDGALLLAEAGSDRIRRLTADGQIATVAGSDQPRDVAFVPPPDSSMGAEPAPLGCFARHARFEVFNFLPGDTETLSAGPRQVAVRVQTSVRARVRILLKWRKVVLRRRVLEEVSNARVATLVKLRARLSEDKRYVVVMHGSSLDDPDVRRCDRRRVRVR